MFRLKGLFFDTDPDGGTGGTGDTSGETSGNGDQTKTPAKSTDYEAAYKGLQRNYDKLKKQLEQLQEKYDAVTEEHEGDKQKLRSVEGQVADLQKQNVDLTSQVTNVKDQEAVHTLEKDRYKLILSEFSDLSQFEADGLLPPGSNLDELREKFTNFRNALEKSGKQRVKDALDGQGAGSVGDDNTRDPGKKRTKEEVYDELLALAGQSTPEARQKYDAVMAEWIGLN